MEMAKKTKARALFISPIDMFADNGMAHGQAQLLSALCSVYDDVDLLSAGAPPALAREWLQRAGIRVNLRTGLFATIARWNTMLWYGGGVILCNKLKLIDRFYFPMRTNLPRSWIDTYDVIVCYYAWHYQLLGLNRCERKVIVDTGDIMADRHERIGVRRWITLTSEDERSVLTSGSRCLAVSEADIAEFEKMYGVRPQLLSFVPPNHRQLIQLASAQMPPRVGFMGAPGFVNEEILRLLSAPVFVSTLRREGIELLIAGGICDTVDRRILSALEEGGARILGPVRSTAEYYAQIAATVNPVGPSTGVKIKSVETLIAGRTLITTRWGADSGLAAAFPGQVVHVNWPPELQALAETCTAAVRSAKGGNEVAAEKYVRDATLRLRESLRL